MAHKAPRRIAQDRAGSTQPPRRLNTVRACVERYLSDHGRMVIDAYRLEVAWRKMAPTFGTLLVGEQVYRYTSIYYQKRVSEGVSPATVKRDLSVLSAAFKHCWKIGVIPYVPAVYQIKKAEPRKRILSVEEMRNLIQAAHAGPQWMYKTVLLLIHTGQRLKAVLELQWSQVDWNANLIDFTAHGLTKAERRKGRGVVPMNSEMRAFMEAWRNFMPGYKLHPRVVGELPGAFYYFWKVLMKKAGLGADVTPHVIRHTIATMLVREGEDIRKVQLMLGHKSLKTTETEYVKNDPETIRGSVETIVKHFEGKKP